MYLVNASLSRFRVEPQNKTIEKAKKQQNKTTIKKEHVKLISLR
jgi:hypothetical protein